MAGRRIFNEQDARRCLAAVRASRSTLAAWARAHGIDGRSLNLWRVNLESRGVPRQRFVTPGLVELVAATMPTARSRYVLYVGGVELEIGDDFDDQALRRSLLKGAPSSRPCTSRKLALSLSRRRPRPDRQLAHRA